MLGASPAHEGQAIRQASGALRVSAQEPDAERGLAGTGVYSRAKLQRGPWRSNAPPPFDASFALTRALTGALGVFFTK